MNNGHIRNGAQASRKVVGYIRVSTEEQAHSGAGLESQKQAIQAECERNGWELVATLEDAGVSAKSLKRPGLTKAIEIIKAGEASVLMASKLDRLSRSVRDVIDLGDFALKVGFDLCLLDCRIDTTTPHGKAQLSLMAVFSQLERELIGQRTREALAIKKQQGVKLGTPVTTSQETTERIVAMRNAGKSLRDIAQSLNSEGIKPAAGGKQFYASSVKSVLDRVGVAA